MVSIFLLILSLLLNGCTSKKTEDAKNVTVALTQFPKSLDPRWTTDATGQRLNQLLFQSFVKFDRDLSIIPDAATWKYLTQKKTYEFQLKTQLSFSDGQAVACEDILFSFEQFKKDTSPFKNSFQIISHVECSQQTVLVTLKEFSAVFLTDLTVFKILPKKLVEKYGDQFGDHIIGSGPYFIEKLEFNEIILKKRQDLKDSYFVDRFLFKIIQDDGTRFLNAYKGAFDIIPMGIPLNKISYLKEKNIYNIITYPAPSMNYLLINFKDPELQKKEYRQALAQSIQIEDIIKYKLEGFGEIATSILPPSNFFHNKTLKNTHYNLAEAQKFWKEVYKKKESQFELTLKTSNNPEVIEIAKVLVEQFRNAGLKVNTQSYEWGTFYGDMKKGQFQIAMMRWVGVSDPDIYRLAFHSSEFPPGRNRGSYKNDRLDSLLTLGTQIENLVERKKHYDQIQQIVFDETAIVPLWYNTQVDLVKKSILNYTPALNGDFSPLLDIRRAL